MTSFMTGLMTSLMTRWILCAALSLIAAPARAETNAELKEQVRQTEIAFAKTLADRNAAAFASFLATETVFMSGARVTRGATQVAERWKAFFDGAQAPFSWAPETVEVLDSGTLAMSSGPVRDPSGKRTGTFNSVWRREANGKLRRLPDDFVGERHVVVVKREATSTPNWETCEFEEWPGPVPPGAHDDAIGI
jgi:ketosteroid isomerase-like protein